MPALKFVINEKIYIKDPQESKFGQRLLKHSIELYYKIGFESFTFKKLAAEMGSVEASIYRYFENKHLLLVYLINWYWKWVSYSIEINTLNITDPKNRLQIIIHQLINSSIENHSTPYINENILQKVVVSEGVKSYHVHSIDEENKLGFFITYKELVETISESILAIDNDFPYSKSLASNLLEMANNQLYFAEHLPRLTDLSLVDREEELEKLLSFFVFRLLE